MNRKLVLIILLFSIFYFLSLNGTKLIIADNYYNNLNNNDNTIFLKSRHFVPNRGITESILSKSNFSSKTFHAIMQFEEIPTEKEKQEFQSNGIKLLNYVPNKAWLVSINFNKLDKILIKNKIRSIADIFPEDKISNMIKSNKIYEKRIKDDKIDLVVEFFKDVPLDDAELIVKKYNAHIIGRVPLINALSITIKKDKINNLIEEDGVLWIEQELPLEDTNNNSRAFIGVDTVQTFPYNLNGSGINVLIYDSSVVQNHTDFGNRLILGENCSVTDDHGTHVAGTVGGDGNLSNGKLKGMAPAVGLISYSANYSDIYQSLYNDSVSIADVNDNFVDGVINHNANIITSSVCNQPIKWGLGCNFSGDYSLHSQLLDSIVYNLSIPITWSIANERNRDCGEYNTISPSSTGKNLITIGAMRNYSLLYYYSSFGPTKDGRIKPDVMALGYNINSTVLDNKYAVQSGTSMATPAVAGTIALIQQDWKLISSTLRITSTVKAILLQTAVDLNNTGPDYASGWGLVNATSAIDLINSYNEFNNIIIENSILNKNDFIANVSGQTEIKFTLAWEDYPGIPLSSINLVNDLDLIVISPNGTTFYPWTLDPNNPGNPALRNQSDNINNVEQVYVNTSDYSGSLDGVWTIEINGTNIPEPKVKYSLVSNNISFTPINQIQCYNSTSWVNCSSIKFYQNLSQIRINFTDFQKDVVNASFKLENFNGNHTFFNSNASFNDTNWWYYNSNSIINESGKFKLTIIGYDIKGYSEKTWEIWEVISNETQCGILNEPNKIYTLTQNISSSGTCLNITANNIIINGQEYTIFYAQTSNGYGVYSSGYNNITIKNLKIVNNRTSSINSSGIYLSEGSGNSIYNNTFNILGNISLNSETKNSGIHLYQVNDTIIENNIINTTNRKGYGILLESFKPDSLSKDNKILNNKIYTNGKDSPSIFLYSHKKDAFTAGGTVNNTVITDNIIKTFEDYSSGIHITSLPGKNSGRTNISRESIITKGIYSYGIYITIIEDNCYVADSSISTDKSEGVYLAAGNTKSYYFTNITYVNESVISGTLIRKWYLNVKVNETNGSNINQANVTGWNVSEAFAFSELTNSNGVIETQELIEYINNAGTKTYYTNYTINVTKTNYQDASQSANLTTNLNLVFTLESASLPNDPHKFIVETPGYAVAWLSTFGNIALKGKCFNNTNCNSPGDNSFMIRNLTDYPVAFINSTGDLCIEKGDCSDESATCNDMSREGFIFRNSSDDITAYIDFDGELCLTGKLYENSNP